MTVCATRGLVGVLAAALLLWAGAPQAHPTPDQEAIRTLLLRWAHGLADADPDEVAPLLHPELEVQLGPARLTRAQYLGALGSAAPMIARVSLAHAIHQEQPDGSVRVGPVVAYFGRQLSSPAALALTLVRAEDGWRIRAIEPGGEPPPEVARALPEHADLQPVQVRLTDAATGQPVAARVHARDAAGTYWPPRGHMRHVATGWRQDVGRDVVLERRTYAYVEPEFVLPVPAGRYTLEVVRGLEYAPRSVAFEVAGGRVPELEVALERWHDIRREGWYSGDTHVHFLDPASALLEMRAEDLHVLNILATKWGELITNVEHFTGAPSPLSTPEHIVFVGEETRHGVLGHAILLGLRRLVYPLTWGGPSEGVPGGDDGHTLFAQSAAARALGGTVTWAHFPFPGAELPANVALGALDSVDLFTWGDPFASGAGIQAPGSVDTWYRFLNTGARLPATAGTDKMLNTQVSGSVRTYVKVDGRLSYAKWLDGVRAGRTFVTTGPILKFRAADRGPGAVLEREAGRAVPVVAEVHSRLPVEWLEIVAGGEVVARRENPDRRRSLRLEASVPIRASTWLAARAYSGTRQPYQRWLAIGADGIPVAAHTSPVYVEVDGQRPRSAADARALVDWLDRSLAWARTQGQFRDDADRQALIDLLERGRAVYEQQLQ